MSEGSLEILKKSREEELEMDGEDNVEVVEDEDGKQRFHLHIKGEIESGDFRGNKRLSCSFTFVYDKAEWKIIRTNGQTGFVPNGTTQICVRSWGKKPLYAWNFPVEVSFSSYSPFGWPKLCMEVRNSAGIGKSPVIGYGWCHVPTSPGKHVLNVPMYRPVASSQIQNLLSFFQGRPIEFFKKEFCCGDEGRAVTRVKYTGAIKIQLNVSLKDFEKFM